MVRPIPKQRRSDAPPASFTRRGFYLHGGWDFNYPFCVRRWKREDFQGIFELLRLLDFNTVMLWPVIEAAPMPMPAADAEGLRWFRHIVDDAKANDMEAWLVQCANLTSRPEITARPLFERHLFPHMEPVRLEREADREAFFKHREEILSILNNADGYVTIDGDPGGYPNAQPEDLLRVFKADREILDRVGVDPARQKLIPWIWCGWGSDWKRHGPWREPLAPLVQPVMELLKREMPEPWEMLPGRSFDEGWANSRTNFEVAEQLGLIERSSLLCYEIIEFEPTPPAVVIQFDDIRRVLREESRHCDTARGIMGNAQQPIMALPNLYFFARATRDLEYLKRSDERVLADLAGFLGGPAELLTAAWQCLRLPLNQLSSDLPDALRRARLTARAAACIPGGPRGYLEILARFVETRITVLRACDAAPSTMDQTVQGICEAVSGLVGWWRLHGYVNDGGGGNDFKWRFTHPGLLDPLRRWISTAVGDRESVAARAAARLAADGVLPADQAVARCRELVCELQN